jgi:hypothetical protein
MEDRIWEWLPFVEIVYLPGGLRFFTRLIDKLTGIWL